MKAILFFFVAIAIVSCSSDVKKFNTSTEGYLIERCTFLYSPHEGENKFVLLDSDGVCHNYHSSYGEFELSLLQKGDSLYVTTTEKTSGNKITLRPVFK